MKRKIIAAFIAVMMVVSLLPMNVMAANTSIYMDCGMLFDYTATTGEAAVYFELHNVPADIDVLVELYSGETLLTDKAKSFTDAMDTISVSFSTVGESSSWTQKDWVAYDAVVPTHAVA